MNTQVQSLMDMTKRTKFQKYDKVKLIEQFDNPTVYTVVETNDMGVVTLCPEQGGILVSAFEGNLQLT